MALIDSKRLARAIKTSLWGFSVVIAMLAMFTLLCWLLFLLSQISFLLVLAVVAVVLFSIIVTAVYLEDK